MKKASRCTHLFGIERCSIWGVDEHEVFRLNVGVCELIIVQEFHRIDQLVRDMSNLIHRVRVVVVVLQEVTVVVETIQHLHAEAKNIAQLVKIQLLSRKLNLLFGCPLIRQPFQYINFKLRVCPTRFFIPMDFYCDNLIRHDVFHLHHLSERTFAERWQNFVSLL